MDVLLCVHFYGYIASLHLVMLLFSSLVRSSVPALAALIAAVAVCVLSWDLQWLYIVDSYLTVNGLTI